MYRKILFILTFALLLRLLLAPLSFHGDLNNNISWGKIGFNNGFNNYYELKEWPYSAPNQPPLYIILFTTLYSLWQSIGSLIQYTNDNIKIFPSSLVWFWESSGEKIIYKLPGILADLGIAFILFKFLIQRTKKKLAIILPCLYLFNPVTIYNSAIWGQTDALVNLFGLYSILAIIDKKIEVSFLSLIISILYKPSLLIFMPVWFLVSVLQKYNYRSWIISSLAGVFIILIVTIWFHPKFDLFFWLTNLYTNKFLSGEIGDLTANGFNLWWLVDSGKTLDTKTILMLPARIWGYLITLFFVGLILNKLRKYLNEENILFSFALSALASFLFMTRIHERYMFPFFPVASLLLGFIPLLLPLYIILSLSHLLNLYHLYWYPPLKALENLYTTPVLAILISLINIFVFFALLVIFLSKKAKDRNNK